MAVIVCDGWLWLEEKKVTFLDFICRCFVRAIVSLCFFVSGVVGSVRERAGVRTRCRSRLASFPGRMVLIYLSVLPRRSLLPARPRAMGLYRERRGAGASSFPIPSTPPSIPQGGPPLSVMRFL